MRKRTIWVIVMAVLMAIPVLARSQTKGHIQLHSRVEVEKEIFNEEGNKVIQRVPSTQAVSGSKVIFTISYKNIGKEVADNVVITNPIPENTLYIEGSAQGASTRITFSVDGGKTYNTLAKLFVYDAAGRKYPARIQDYTHIRWTFETPLPPGATGEVSFRAVLR